MTATRSDEGIILCIVLFLMLCIVSVSVHSLCIVLFLFKFDGASKLKKFDALIRVVGAHGPDGTQGQRGLCSGGVSN